MNLTFGKYKNESVDEVFNKDPSYLNWLKTQPFIKDNKELIDYIEKKLVDFNDEYIMKWGKYKNKSLSQINEIDNKYIQWLKSSDYVNKNCTRLVKELESY